MIVFIRWMLSFFTDQPCEENSRVGQFELFMDAKNEFRFRLKAANGEIILASEGYTTKGSANRGIAAVRKNSVLDKRYERKNMKNGKPMFNLRSGNNQVIGTSEAYESDAAREVGIQSVKLNTSEAKVKDLTA